MTLKINDYKTLFAYLKDNGPKLIAIDGYCGSGKTTLAEMLEDYQVIHTDHFYLPFEKRDPDWKTIVGGNMDFEKLLNEVILPYSESKKVHTSFYNVHKGVVEAEFDIDPDKPLCIEGSYSLYSKLRDYYDLKIFLRCEDEKQKERLRIRQGEDISGFENIWIPKERAYYLDQKVVENTDIIIETDDLF